MGLKLRSKSSEGQFMMIGRRNRRFFFGFGHEIIGLASLAPHKGAFSTKAICQKSACAQEAPSQRQQARQLTDSSSGQWRKKKSWSPKTKVPKDFPFF